MGGFKRAKKLRAADSKKTYIHPHSPKTGDYWMKKAVCFNTLKLTSDTKSHGDKVSEVFTCGCDHPCFALHHT